MPYYVIVVGCWRLHLSRNLRCAHEQLRAHVLQERRIQDVQRGVIRRDAVASPAMWGMVLLIAFGASLDPMRMGIAVLLISRPRPVLTLLAFWLGGMTTGVTVALFMLWLVRDVASAVSQHVAAMANSAIVAPLQIAGGVVALLIGAKIAVSLSARRRAPVLVSAGDAPAPMLAPNAPNAFSRVSGRVRDALEGGNLWVSFVVGLGSATPPIETLIVFTAILASGAAVGVQFSAAMVFTVVTLAVIEIPLLTYLVTPAKTQAVMLQLQGWIRARRTLVAAIFLIVTGVALVATGIGVI
jgi:hypothetical protein